MSRNIMTTKKEDLEEKQLKDTQIGKLIFTEYKQKKCALLISENRLKAAQFFPKNVSKIGAIYVAKVKNVVKNIDAYFVEIENREICFLPKAECQTPYILNREFDGRILEGDEILVQVTRDPQKTKQASVSTNISISNSYFAIGIGTKKTGFSNKISKEDKIKLQNILIENDILNQNQLSDRLMDTTSQSIGLVIRTQAIDLLNNINELLNQFQNLWNEFNLILTHAKYRSCFSCLKNAQSELESVFNSLVYPQEYNEIITDNEELFKELKSIKENNNTEFLQNDIQIRLYQDKKLSLKNLYSLEAKMETALNSRIWLKSGGYLIIEQTEALTVIDVNSGKNEPKKASYESQYLINKEAGAEIALQMRLRNLSGIIIVDFINMESEEMKSSLIKEMKRLTNTDKIKTSVIDITALGLMEITRKKTTKTLKEQFLLS